MKPFLTLHEGEGAFVQRPKLIITSCEPLNFWFEYMCEWFWVDGIENGQVPADDRGLNLADGVFETIRIEKGELKRLDLHSNRLTRGVGILGFAKPDALVTECIREANQRVEEKLWGMDGSLRLTVTRGSGPRGYAPPASPIPRIIIRLSEGLRRDFSPLNLMVSGVLWSNQPVLNGSKHLARIEQVLALSDAFSRGFEDAIMLSSTTGTWQSTCMGNLFLRIDNALFTPPIIGEGIAGTRRRAIIDSWASAVGFDIHEEPLTESIVSVAEEAFSCNSLVGVRSIASVDNLTFSSRRAAECLRPLIHQQP